MSIDVKFFASLREQIGKSDIQIESTDSLTCAKIWAQVCNNAPLPSHILMAVNKEYAVQSAPVQDGDEVAFFPPVTGG